MRQLAIVTLCWKRFTRILQRYSVVGMTSFDGCTQPGSLAWQLIPQKLIYHLIADPGSLEDRCRSVCKRVLLRRHIMIRCPLIRACARFQQPHYDTQVIARRESS
jgi:hypothetical protein